MVETRSAPARASRARRARPWAEIIGVVGDVRNNGAGCPTRPEAFISMEMGRDSWNQLFLIVRSESDSSALLPSIREAVASTRCRAAGLCDPDDG